MKDKKVEDFIYSKKIIKPKRKPNKKPKSSIKITHYKKYTAVSVKFDFKGYKNV